MKTRLTKLDDCWDQITDGIEVKFRGGVPIEFRPYDEKLEPDISQLKSSLEDLGYSNFTIDPDFLFISFDDELDRQLIRVGVHYECTKNLEDCVWVDPHENGHDVVLYDEVYRADVSPIIAIKVLEDIPDNIGKISFWETFKTYYDQVKPNPKEFDLKWIKIFDSKPEFKYIADMYYSWNFHQQDMFHLFTGNDPQSMIKLANHLDVTPCAPWIPTPTVGSLLEHAC